eukprot:scaffold36269_cov124-Isochrysis_galbana.AAC.2
MRMPEATPGRVESGEAWERTKVGFALAPFSIPQHIPSKAIPPRYTLDEERLNSSSPTPYNTAISHRVRPRMIHNTQSTDQNKTPYLKPNASACNTPNALHR